MADQQNVEYALMVCWEDGDVEYVTAADPTHAERMAKTLYAGAGSTYTVGREVQPWRYVRVLDAVLTDTLAR